MEDVVVWKFGKKDRKKADRPSEAVPPPINFGDNAPAIPVAGERIEITKPIRTGRARGQVICPIFLKYAKNTEDEFWREKLEEIAHGKTPRLFSIRNGKLSFRDSRHFENLFIVDDPMAGERYIEFIRKFGHIHSPEDIRNEENNKRISSSLQTGVDLSRWDNIKTKKKLVDFFLRRYACEVAEKYSLDKEGLDDLITTINIWYMRKKNPGDNIILEDGAIKKIVGLAYEEESRKFIIFPKITTKVKVLKTDKQPDPFVERFFSSSSSQTIPRSGKRRYNTTYDIGTVLLKQMMSVNRSSTQRTIASEVSEETE